MGVKSCYPNMLGENRYDTTDGTGRVTDPPIQQHGAVVTIQGEALPLLYRAVLALAARHHRDGIIPPPLLHELRAALLRATTTSPPRHQLDETPPTGPCSARHDSDLIDSATAAQLLAVSRRTMQRLAATDDGNLLGAVRCGSIWLYRRGAVVALAQRKAAAK